MIKNSQETLVKKMTCFSAKLLTQTNSSASRKERIYQNAINYFLKEQADFNRPETVLVHLAGFLARIRFYGKDTSTDFYLYRRLIGPALYLVDKNNNRVLDYVGIVNLNSLKKSFWPTRGRLLKVLAPAFEKRQDNLLTGPLVKEEEGKWLHFPLLPFWASIKPSSIKLEIDK